MFVSSSLSADHKDLIHDVAYDFHGRRMATCSSDQSVKIWDQGEGGEWHCSANWKTHSGSVWRVTWAHPEFGQVIATCSFDRTASVWEELVVDSSPDGSHKNWVKKACLVDSRTSVTDVQFCPKHLGLQLATCSSDGIVRIYEAPDVMNLSQWSLQFEIVCKLSCSCLSWNPSRMHSPMIAVGSDDSNPSAGGKVLIYEYYDNNRKWQKVETIMSITDPVRDVEFSPNLGRSYHLLGIASKDVHIISIKPLRKEQLGLIGQAGINKFEMRPTATFDEHKATVWRLSWNVTGTVLATSGDDGCVRVWKGNYLENWKCIAVLRGDGSQVKPGEPQTQTSANSSAANGQSSNARYIRSGPVSHLHVQNQVGYH